MTRVHDLPDVIPVFPLPGALLLPRSRLPLHLFEPRYLAMFDDTLKTRDRLIGMIQPNEMPGRDGTNLHTIGCAGRITQFSETEDGRYMVTLTGISRFRIKHEIDGFSPYRRCEVSWSDFRADRGGTESDPGFDRDAFFALLARFFSVRQLDTDWDALKQADTELLVNSLAMLLGFEPEDKQALLEAPSLVTRRETLVTLVEFALLSGDGKEQMQ